MRSAPDRQNREALYPPPDVISMTRAVLGTIDLDPYSTPDGNRLVGAARFFNRDTQSIEDIINSQWATSEERRVFLGLPPSAGAVASRRLLHKTLKEYRKGYVKQAMIWIGIPEIITRLPWLWDFPICFPYRRLRPCYFESDIEMFRKVNPSSWSLVVFLPPCSRPKLFARATSQFHLCFTGLGRVVMNEHSGEDDWLHGYRALMKKSYDFHK